MATPPRILVLGYNAWDVNLPVKQFPRQDAKYEVDCIRFGGGGPGASAAIAMVRLGANVQLVTQLGDDVPARLQYEELVSAGVDVSLSRVVEGYESPKAVILVHPEHGERTIFWSRGDLPSLAATEVDTAWLADRDMVYTDGHETAAAAVLAAAARERGLPVVMDCGSVREGTEELVSQVTDAISSAGFAPELTGCRRPDEALRELRRRGPERVAMTCGADGVLALVGDQIRHIPAFAVPVVDTTGAGDAFHAGYAYARVTNQGFLESLAFGSAVAALKCQDWGGRRALPDLATVQKFLRSGTRRPVPEHFKPLLD